MKFLPVGAFVAAFIVVAAGCSKESPAVSENAPVLAVDSTVPRESKPADAPRSLHAAKLAAVEFLDLLGAQNAAAVERTSIPFRKQITSTLFFDQEKALGYSNSDVLKFLRTEFNQATAALIRSESWSPTGNEVVFRGTFEGKEPMTFSLRLAKSGDVWTVTRFASSYNRVPVSPATKKNPELSWARETALDFLELCLGIDRDYTLAMALMTEELKSRLPSPTVHDAGLTYAKKDVRAWLNRVRFEVSGFAVTGEAMIAGAAAFDGQLIGANKQRSFRLLLRPDGGDWKIDQFDVK